MSPATFTPEVHLGPSSLPKHYSCAKRCVFYCHTILSSNKEIVCYQFSLPGPDDTAEVTVPGVEEDRRTKR